VLNSGGDGLPPGVGETAPRRDSQARQSSGATLLCQSIKCSYACVGTGACEDVGKARVGALERSGPRPRGSSALERGGPRSRGGLGPRARRTPLEGVQGPRARRTSGEGASTPRARRTSPEGRLLCCLGGPRGPPGLWLCCVRALGVQVDLRFAFFAGFKRVSPRSFRVLSGCFR
jgi:hypothetical protein